MPFTARDHQITRFRQCQSFTDRITPVRHAEKVLLPRLPPARVAAQPFPLKYRPAIPYAGLPRSVQNNPPCRTDTSAINLRFSRSRSPAEPNTVMTFPFVISRAVSIATFSALGVCAKSTMAVKACPISMSSMRPGTPANALMPLAAIPGSIPSPVHCGC